MVCDKTRREDRPNVSGFFLAGSMLTLLIALDDLLLLHESANLLVRRAEYFLVGVYGLLALAYGFTYRTVMRRFDTGLLVMAVVALGVSVGWDALVRSASDAAVLIEDGAKLVGYAAWATFLVRAAMRTVQERTRRLG